MEKSRVTLFKEYRDSLRKQANIENSSNYYDEHHNLTSSIPLDGVINHIKEDNAEFNAVSIARRKRKTFIAITSIVGTVLVIVLVLIGIKLWR